MSLDDLTLQVDPAGVWTRERCAGVRGQWVELAEEGMYLAYEVGDPANVSKDVGLVWVFSEEQDDDPGVIYRLTRDDQGVVRPLKISYAEAFGG